jgi:hypothetical protein
VKAAAVIESGSMSTGCGSGGFVLEKQVTLSPKSLLKKVGYVMFSIFLFVVS